MTYAVDLSNLALEANGTAAGITANATAISTISVGNSTINTTINATSFSINGSPVVGVNTSAQYLFSNTISFGNSTVNSSINATSLTVGSNVATFGTAVYHVANGNVGIANTTPSNTLSVTGTAYISGALTTGSNVATFGTAVYHIANGYVGISNAAPGSLFTVSSGVSAFESLLEKATVSATAATGTVNLDVLTQGVLYYTSNASANFTLNVRGSSGATANSIIVNGQSLTVTFLNTNGTTAYYPNVFSVDSTTVTPKWFGGTTPTGGNSNSVDAYTYSIIKTANSTYTVLATQAQFK